METVIRSVGDLTAPDRSAIERVVGHQLGESQQLVIQVISVVVPKSPVAAKGQSLPAWCNVYEGMTEAEIDELHGSIVRDHSSRDLPTF
jgi:hypothetical protein